MTVTLYYKDKWTAIAHGDCREILPVFFIFAVFLIKYWIKGE